MTASVRPRFHWPSFFSRFEVRGAATVSTIDCEELGPARCIPARIVTVLAMAALGYAALIGSVPARADTVAYLVNVTVRPGYNFANAAAALDYGYGICDKVAAGRGYADLVGDVKADFNTSDEFHASYLISQAVGELCPALIWQLRNSAANYRPPAG
jgi:Protein of unknown function (DUF732)